MRRIMIAFCRCNDRQVSLALSKVECGVKCIGGVRANAAQVVGIKRTK